MLVSQVATLPTIQHCPQQPYILTSYRRHFANYPEVLSCRSMQEKYFQCQPCASQSLSRGSTGAVSSTSSAKEGDTQTPSPQEGKGNKPTTDELAEWRPGRSASICIYTGSFLEFARSRQEEQGRGKDWRAARCAAAAAGENTARKEDSRPPPGKVYSSLLSRFFPLLALNCS